MAITDKNKHLIELVHKGLEPSEAYKQAGYKGTNPAANSSEILNKPECRAYMVSLQESRLERTLIDADSLLVQLQDMRIADYAEIICPDSGSFLPINEWPLVWRQMIAGIEIVEYFEGQGKDKEHVGNVHKVKFIDRSKIIKMFGDHVNIQGFQKTEVHVHAHLHESAARIRQGRERSREIEVNRQPVITGQTVPLEDLPDSENSESLEQRVGAARQSERYHTRGDGR